MDIEIVVIGTSSRWVLSQPHIRIGRDPECEVNLPAAQYPAVFGEHVALDVVNGTLRLASLGGDGSATFLNDNPAAAGFVVRSGDALRLGAGGPELRIRLIERESYAPPAGYVPTSVLDAAPQAAYEATSVEFGPARVPPIPVATAISPAPPPPTKAPGRYGYGTESIHAETIVSPVAQPRLPSAAAPRRPDAPAPGASKLQGNLARESRGPVAPPAQPAAAECAADSEKLHALEGKLKGMRIILWANLAVLLLLVFQLGQQLEQNRQELRELRAQAQSAVGQLTPSLDARLSVFEKRMDGIDIKMKAAEEEMAGGMDAKMRQAEDRMVSRMNAEIPAMLDKYISRKLAEVKR